MRDLLKELLVILQEGRREGVTQHGLLRHRLELHQPSIAAYHLGLLAPAMYLIDRLDRLAAGEGDEGRNHPTTVDGVARAKCAVERRTEKKPAR